MNQTVEISEQNGMQAARESFSGKGLTESQFQEAWAISKIIHEEIKQSGSFREKLTDYSHAFARSEKFDAMRAESTIRDVYGGRYAQSMNQTREALKERMESLEKADPELQAKALQAAETIEGLIKEGPTQPFYKAYDQASSKLADELKITQSGAKELMKEAYKNANGPESNLYEASKQIEEAYHKPVREAEIAARKQDQLERGDQSRTQSRSMG